MTAIAKRLVKYQDIIGDDYAIMHNANEGASASTFDDILEVSGIAKRFLTENIFDLSVKIK